MGSSDRRDKSSSERPSIEVGTGHPSAEKRYLVEAEIGSGATSSVFRAWDRLGRRNVALKILNSPMKTEWDTLAGLTHPSIVVLLDSGLICHPLGSAPRPFIAMELLEGLPLKQRMPEIREWKLAVQIIQNVARALATAHHKNILHCDIKPSNIFVHTFANGQLSSVKVLDFGLATRISGSGGVFAEGGTYAYMSPEQILGKEVNHASDVFSLGAVAYQLLTRKHPFTNNLETAGREELSDAISNRIPAYICDVNSTVPESVAWVIHRTLAKEADARPDAVDLPSLLEEPDVYRADRLSVERTLKEIRTASSENRLSFASDRLRSLERKGYAFNDIVLFRHQIDASLADQELTRLNARAREGLASNEIQAAAAALEEAKRISGCRFDIRVLKLEGELQFRQQEEKEAEDLLSSARREMAEGATRKAEWLMRRRENLVNSLQITFGHWDLLAGPPAASVDSDRTSPLRGDLDVLSVTSGGIYDPLVDEALALESKSQNYKLVLQKTLDFLNESDPDKRSLIVAELEQNQQHRQLEASDVMAAVADMNKRRQSIINSLRELLSRSEKTADLAGALQSVEALDRIVPTTETKGKRNDLEQALTEAADTDFLERLRRSFASISEIGHWEAAGRILNALEAKFPYHDWQAESRTVVDQVLKLPERDEHVNQALAHLKLYDRQTAVLHLESALALDPQNKALALSVAALLLGTERIVNSEDGFQAQGRAQDLLRYAGEGPMLRVACDLIKGPERRTKAAAATGDSNAGIFQENPYSVPSIPSIRSTEPNNPDPDPEPAIVIPQIEIVGGVPPHSAWLESVRPWWKATTTKLSSIRQNVHPISPRQATLGLLSLAVTALFLVGMQTAWRRIHTPPPPKIRPGTTPVHPPIAPPQTASAVQPPGPLSFRFVGNIKDAHITLDDADQPEDFEIADLGGHTFKATSRSGTEVEFSFRAHTDAPPEVNDIKTGRNTSVIVVGTLRSQAIVYTSPGREPVKLDSEMQGDGMPSGLLVNLAQGTAADQPLTVGEGKLQRQITIPIANTPNLQVFVSADLDLGSFRVLANVDDAKAWVDGEPIRRRFHNRQLTLNGVQLGTYDVKVVKDGFCVTPGDAKVVVKRGREEEVSFNLQPFPALRVEGLPTGAKVLFDDKEIGGQTVGTVLLGNHSIKVKASGYEDFSGSLSFSCGSDTFFKAAERLVRTKVSDPPPPAKAILAISVSPAGARVMVSGGEGNRIYTDVTKPLDLEPGTYRIHASLDGFQDADKTVTLRAADNDAESVTLQRRNFSWRPPLASSVNEGWAKAAEFSVYGDTDASGAYEFRLRKHGSLNPSFGNWILGYRAGGSYVEFRVQSKELQSRSSDSNRWEKIGDIELAAKTNSLFVRVRVSGSTVTHEIGVDGSHALPIGSPTQIPMGAIGLARNAEIKDFSH